jgi:hypothetical protein
MQTTRVQGPLHRCCSLSLRLFVSLSLLELTRAKGLAGLMREGQKYILWGCGEGAGLLLNISKIWVWLQAFFAPTVRRYGTMSTVQNVFLLKGVISNFSVQTVNHGTERF